MKQRRAWTRGVLVSVAIASAMLGSAALGQEKKIPDDWFFDGAKRPEPLKSLEGKAAPELSASTWIGDAVKLADLKGKVVVVDFWATWCGPCMASIPENVELVEKYKDKGLAFVGVHDSNSGWDEAPKVVKEKKINYPVAKDSGSSVKAYNLQFWPTYVVIDHKGIVRAAGLTPNHVKDVVEMLLKDLPAAGAAEAASGNPAEWYFGGNERPSWMKEAEGKEFPKITSDNWYRKPLTEEERKGKVNVVHFLNPTGGIGLKQLQELKAIEKEFASAGVVVYGVCDARADWLKANDKLIGARIELPVLRDIPVDPPAKRPGLGVVGEGLGIKLAPTTVIVGRDGKVRAAGVRADRVREIVTKLLAEPTPEK